MRKDLITDSDKVGRIAVQLIHVADPQSRTVSDHYFTRPSVLPNFQNLSKQLTFK